MIIAALLVVPLLALENADLGGAWPAILTVGDWAIWTAFVAEAIVMLRVVSDRGAWLRDHPLEVIVIVFSFPLLSSAFAAIRVLRVLRLVRLLRLAKLARVAFSMTGLRYVTLLAVLTVIAGGEAFSQLEGKSLADGFYWAITTMTTVGYGDLSPKTDSGKILAVAVMLVGIGFVAVLTGAVAQRFIVANVEAVEEAVEREEFDLRVELHEISERLARVQRQLDS